MIQLNINIGKRTHYEHKKQVADALGDFKKAVKKTGLMTEIRDRTEFRTKAERQRIKRDRAGIQRTKDAKHREKKRFE